MVGKSAEEFPKLPEQKAIASFTIKTETMEEMVVYTHPDPVKGEDANTMWVRPIKMFLETVNKDGKGIPRFEFIEPKRIMEKELNKRGKR